MKILITGVVGFVGVHLLDHYIKRDIYPVMIDPRLGPTSTVEHFTATNDESYDVVYHCGAFVGGRAGIDSKPAYLHTYNTALDALMFSWALKTKPKRFVYFSSSAAYPERYQSNKWKEVFLGHEPLVEDDINFDSLDPPEATYGLSKLHGEQMARSVSSEVPVTVLRPFSGYGADQNLAYPFPKFIERAKGKESPFKVWGSGQQVRDWIHIDDFVEAATVAAHNGIDGPVNLCTGVGTTFDELAQLCMSKAGYSAEIEHVEMGPSNGVDYRVGDPTKLHEFYTPKISLDEGVERALQR
jgi:nucleoside-diphosphate-sugar epimerase